MASEKKLKKDNWNVYNCYRHLLRFSPGLFRETSFLLSFWQQAFNTAKATFSDPFNIMIQASFSSMKGLLPFRFVHMLRNCCRNFLATILQDSTGISAAENLHQIMSILGRTFLWKSKHKIKKKNQKKNQKKTHHRTHLPQPWQCICSPCDWQQWSHKTWPRWRRALWRTLRNQKLTAMWVPEEGSMVFFFFS